MTSSTCIGAILLTLGGCAGNAFAYRWDRCGARDQRLKWDHNTVRFRVHETSFPATGLLRYGLAEAAAAFNRTPSNFRYELVFGERSIGRRNDQNEIWFSERWDEDDKPARARTWWHLTSCKLKEADIIFNNTVPWGLPFTVDGVGNKSSFWPYAGGERPFTATALHEMGHAQGMNHEERVYNIMGQDWTLLHTNGTRTAAYPGVDAVRGSMDTYGRLPPGVNQDLSVTHFKWVYPDDRRNYSIHDRTHIFNREGEALVNVIDGIIEEPVYAVRPGQTIQVEFGYENLGVPGAEVQVNYYLSTDDNISTADTFLATRWLFVEDSVQVDAASTRVTLTIPSTLIPGVRYWIGAVIDPLNVRPEVDEGNNATYIGIEVVRP